MIKLVTFDWNGTIFPDTRAVLECVNIVFKQLNLKSVSLKSFRDHFDVPITRTYLGLGAPKELLKNKSSEIVKIFHASYEVRAAKIRTRAYAKELLKWLSKKHIKSIIFSNHINEPIRKQLKRLKINHYFSDILANSELDSSIKGRNKQDKLKIYMHDNKLSKKDVLIVGDTLEEIEIGKELGIKTVAITHGFCSIKRLKATKPDYLINSLKEVIDIIYE